MESERMMQSPFVKEVTREKKYVEQCKKAILYILLFMLLYLFVIPFLVGLAKDTPGGPFGSGNDQKTGSQSAQQQQPQTNQGEQAEPDQWFVAYKGGRGGASPPPMAIEGDRIADGLDLDFVFQQLVGQDTMRWVIQAQRDGGGEATRPYVFTGSYKYYDSSDGDPEPYTDLVELRKMVDRDCYRGHIGWKNETWPIKVFREGVYCKMLNAYDERVESLLSHKKGRSTFRARVPFLLGC